MPPAQRPRRRVDGAPAGAVSCSAMSLLSLYDLSLRGRREVPALETDGKAGETRAFTFGDIDARSDRLAQVLAARGVVAGDRLAFCLPNGIAVVDLWLAAVKLGAIIVPINVLYRGREIGHILGDARPRAVVATQERCADFEATVACWEIEALEADAMAAPAVRPVAPLDASTPVALVYTSGT